MAKPVIKPTQRPFQEAVEELLMSYGAKDWAIVARGDNLKMLAGDLNEFQAKFWAAGTGEKDKKAIDDISCGLLISDLEFLRAAMLKFLLEP